VRSAVFSRLADPALYVEALGLVASKQAERGRSEPLIEGGPTAQAVLSSPEALSKLLARSVASARYEFGPVTPHVARIEGKDRTLFRAAPLDRVVQQVLARGLAQWLEPYLSPHVHSYRAGRSSLGAVRTLLAYVDQHRKQWADPKQRGLYVVRRDVRAYGDSIPAGPDSALWGLLQGRLAMAGLTVSGSEMAFLRAAMRPQVRLRDGTIVDDVTGIPTGSPLQTLACNLYLSRVDEIGAAPPAAFYARYGDDILFAHPTAETALLVARDMDLAIQALGLTFNPQKSEHLYWNSAARPSPEAQFRGVSHFKYLGTRVGFDGTLGLAEGKSRRLLVSLRARLRSADALLGQAPFAERAQLLCDVVNVALQPEHPTAEPASQLLRYVLWSPSQLKDLDYKVALTVAEVLTGRRGVRAFRGVAIRRLRREYGLVSLLLMRQRSARPRQGRR